MESYLMAGKYRNTAVDSQILSELLARSSAHLDDFPSSEPLDAKAHYRLGKIFYDKADLNSAERFFLETLRFWNVDKEYFSILKTLGFLVRISAEKMDDLQLERYLMLARQLLDQASQLGRDESAEFFYYQGMVATFSGNFLEAIGPFKKAYMAAQEENSPEVLAKTVFALSTAFYHIQDYNNSLKFLDQLSEILQAISKKYIYAAMRLLYGNIFTQIGEYDTAMDQYARALEALKEKCCWNLVGEVLMGRGVVCKKRGEFNQALSFFDQALMMTPVLTFKRLSDVIRQEIDDVNDSNVDLLLDRENRMIYEKNLGPIDFKHRFILLEILFMLAHRPGIYFDKEDLAKSIWKDEYNPLIHDKLIYTSVSRLRKLIEPKNTKRRYIIRGKDGYCFSTTVHVRFHRDNDITRNKRITGIDLSTPA